MAYTLEQLLNTLPQTGTVQWIGLRPKKRHPLTIVNEVNVSIEEGLIGDRYSSNRSKRQVTLIQQEHLSAIASLLNREECPPELLRRNIVVKGINLLALKGKRFQIGSSILEHTGLCHPCSRMEEIFGDGGYNAVRGHGGITAQVIQSGVIALNDQIRAL